MTELFQPLDLGRVHLKNRIVMPPMVTFHLGVQDGVPTEAVARHYQARAAGGVGMIIVEASCVEPGGRLAQEELGLWDGRQMEGHSRLVSLVHGEGVPILAQIHHAGPRSVTGAPAGPSRGRWTVLGKAYDVRELSLEDIRELRLSFVRAACRAKECGYDGVELHCCHSYLLCAFLSPQTNLRTDEYGCGLQGRLRLPLEILGDIRKACGPDFLISVRMGYDEPDLESSLQIAAAFEVNGADLLHISTGFGSSGAMDESIFPPAPDASGLNIRIWGAGQIRRRVSCPVIAVGGIRQPQQAAQALSGGYADLIAVGRSLLCNPQWAREARTGQVSACCKNCKHCIWGRRFEGCPGKRRSLC